MVRVPPLEPPVGWVIRLGIGFHSVVLFFFKFFVFCSMFFRSAHFPRVHRLQRRLFSETPRHRHRRIRDVLPLSCAKFN